MKKQFLLTAIIVVLFLAGTALYASWVDVDNVGQDVINVSQNPGNTTGYVPAIAVDGNGFPHITWYDNRNGISQVFYLRWNGVEWVDAYGSAGWENIIVSDPTHAAENPRIALDSLDRPNIVWEDGFGADNREIYYVKWNGSTWVDVTGSPGLAGINVSNVPYYSGHPCIVLDSMNHPQIAWQNQDGADVTQSDIYYTRWDGAAWRAGDGAFGNAKVYDSAHPSDWPFLCVDSADSPHLTWSDGPASAREIYYVKLTSGVWADATGAGLSGISIYTSPNYKAWSKMDIDSAGRPHIVWEDDDEGGQNIYYLHWNGSAWVDATGAGTGAINVSQTYHYATVPMIQLDAADVPHVIYSVGAVETCDIFCVKWNGSTWTDETGSGTAYREVFFDDVNSEWPYFALDGSGNPHVVWSDGVIFQHHDINYLHWVPEGTPTITPTVNLSATVTTTWTYTRTISPTVTMTLTQTMTPVVAPPINPGPCWSDADGVGYENNPVSGGSATVLKLDSAGNPHIAWKQGDSINYMRWNGSRWVNAAGSWSNDYKISGTVFNCEEPDLVLDSMDRPHVAWTGFFYDWTMVYYLRWNGASWVDVSGADQMRISVPIVTGGYARDVSLALDGAMRPHMAWVDYPEGKTWTVKDVMYFKWDGSDWVDADGSGRSDGMVTDNTLECTKPSLVVDSLGRAHIAYKYWHNDERYLQWNGSSWVDASGAGTSYIDAVSNPGVTDSYTPGLCMDPLLYPLIAFPCRIAGTSYACYVKWDGSSWVDATGAASQAQIALPVGTGTQNVSLAMDSGGRPCVSWTAGDGLYFMKWDGGAWVGADGIGTGAAKVVSFAPGDAGVSLAIGPSDSANIAWDDDTVPSNFFLKYICNPTLTPTITPTSPSATITPTPSMTATATMPETATPTQTQTPEPALITIHKSAQGNPAASEITYTILITNDPAKPVYNITVWDTLSAQLEYISTVSGPEPAVTGNYLFWDFGGGMVGPGESFTLIFVVKVRNPRPDQLIANTAASDYNDDYYAVERHPAVYSNQAFYPEGATALYPNPFNPDTAAGGTLKFVNMPDNCEVRIYSLNGEFVSGLATVNNCAFWNGKNSYGARVSAGIYYYIVKDTVTLGIAGKGKIFLIYR